MENRKKISVVNRTNFKNYGSVLQCYALCEAISQLGYESQILWETGTISKHYDFRIQKLFSAAVSLLRHPGLVKTTLAGVKTVKTREISPKTAMLFDAFVENNIRQTLMTHRELKKAARSGAYAKFVCGSDQVWCSTTLYVDPLMYLRFAPKEKRVAYAPSIGRNYIPGYNRKKMKKYISEIPSVSIRETEGRRLIKELTGANVPVVADPTLLLNADRWSQLEADMDTGSGYMVCYFLTEPNETVQKQIVKTAKEHSLRILALNAGLVQVSQEYETEHPDCGPSEFLKYIANAELVITDSYHGMLFAINYRKNFYAVEREYGRYDQSSRQLTVVQKLGLEKRYLRLDGEVQFSLEQLDYAKAEGILDAFVSESLAYLKSALEG